MKGRATVAMMSGLLLAGGAQAQGVAVATQAQVSGLDKRVGALESQMRAVQRQVFPGGDRRFFAPEPVPPAEPEPAPGAPAAVPLADLQQRVVALETQQRVLTGQVEELQFRLRQLEQAQTRMREDSEFRLNALEGRGAAPPPAIGAPPAASVVPANPPASAPAAVAPAPATSATQPPLPADPVEARYVAGYRLYASGQHAAAAKALGEFVAANPRHPRASHAQFWSGRAMMAQGQHAQAAKAFLDGYQRFPRGERAPNSLLWLGRALTALDRKPAACQALDELRKAYPDRLTGQLATDAAAARTAAGCAA